MVRKNQKYTGVIHGNAIELNGKTDLPDGQEVAVTIQPLDRQSPIPGEGLRRSAGGWNDDPDGLDSYLEWNRLQRKNQRREIDR